VIDIVHEVAPNVLERLAMMRARKRRFVSKSGTDIHPGRRDLKVMQTRSGWWISANVGLDDTVRNLQALCHAASLKYGSDIKIQPFRRT
jgi:hypothetical protein